MGTPGSNETVLYHYEPSLTAAAIACALFALSTCLHLYQTCATRSWYTIPLLIGGVCEVVGYIGRILGASEAPEYSLAPFIVQSILILIAPPLIAATVYMAMGHIIRATDGDGYSLVREKVLTKVFVIGDILSFLVQSSGAGMLAKKDPDAKSAGKWIIIGGLAVQLIFFGFFMIVMFVFWTRLRQRPTQQSKLSRVQWRSHLCVLVVASILIMVRSVFRLIEYVQGDDGYLLKHEIYLYIFDAALMFAALFTFNIIHPTGISAVVKGGTKVHWGFMLQQVDVTVFSEKRQHQGGDEEDFTSPLTNNPALRD